MTLDIVWVEVIHGLFWTLGSIAQMLNCKKCLADKLETSRVVLLLFQSLFLRSGLISSYLSMGEIWLLRSNIIHNSTVPLAILQANVIGTVEV